MRSSSSREKPRDSSVNCSSDQPPRTTIHSPAGTLCTRSASILSVCCRDVTPSNRSSSCSAARTQWAWLSINPGMTVRPARSMTRVCGPLSASISAVVPTLRMRSPLMASACAMVKRSSTVTILPLTSTISGACALAGPAAVANNARTSKMARPNDDRMLNPLAIVCCSGGGLDGAAGRRLATYLSSRLHAPLFEGCSCRRRRDELDERLGAVRILRAHDDAAREHGELLDVRRQRTDVVDSGEVRELAYLLEADFGFTTGNDAPDKHAGRGLLELALDLVGDAHALEQADDIDAAGTGRVADRSCRQDRLLQGFGCADVGF